MALLPSRGEIWTATLDPILGHEQGGHRPVLIISTNTFNHGPGELVLVLPITSRRRPIPFHIPLEPPEGGLRVPSYILCDAIRSITHERLSAKPWGRVSPATMKKVEDILKVLMEIF